MKTEWQFLVRKAIALVVKYQYIEYFTAVPTLGAAVNFGVNGGSEPPTYNELPCFSVQNTAQKHWGVRKTKKPRQKPRKNPKIPLTNKKVCAKMVFHTVGVCRCGILTQHGHLTTEYGGCQETSL